MASELTFRRRKERTRARKDAAGIMILWAALAARMVVGKRDSGMGIELGGFLGRASQAKGEIVLMALAS